MKIQAYLFMDKRKFCIKEFTADEIPEEFCLPTKSLVEPYESFELVFKQEKGPIRDRNLDTYMVGYHFKGVRPK